MNGSASDTRNRIGRGIWRGVYSAIVDHSDFQALTAHERLVLLVCRVGSLNTAASIFRLYREPLREQTGLTAEELEVALGGLEKKPTSRAPWIIRDDQVLWIRNGLKHDPNISWRHEGHKKAILRAIAALPNTSTVKKFRRYYKLTRGSGGALAEGVGEATQEGQCSTPTPKQDKTTPNPKTTEPPPAPSDASAAQWNEADEIKAFGRPLTLLERLGRHPLPARLSEGGS